MKKSLKLLRQVNLFSGRAERENHVSTKKKTVSIKERFEKKVNAKNSVRNFFENQLMLPVVGVVGMLRKKEKLLPLVPDDYLEKGFPDLVTKHRAFRVSDSVNNELTVEQTRRRVFTMSWDDNLIISMHDDLIHKSLEVLTYDGVPEEKWDVISWIFAEDILVWHARKVKVETIPFSFKACCMLCGYDYTILQDYIYSKLTPQYKQLVDNKPAQDFVVKRSA